MLDIDLVKNHARKIVESGQEHDFIVLIEGARGVTITKIVLDEEAKGNFARFFSALLSKEGATEYISVNEGWATESNRPLREGIRVSELPLDDRKEILMITHVYRNSKFYMESAEILDTPQGHKLGKFEAIDNAEGRMLVKEW